VLRSCEPPVFLILTTAYANILNEMQASLQLESGKHRCQWSKATH